ncbi:carboxypeptidase-like regulatory domain-containing protein, partial [Escherichia coli]|uniref:carboxypeptidase-like regulatory domain-containing protein n=1 Tax=Escherichia coli TaxID=562 RepID=UPI0013D39806
LSASVFAQSRTITGTVKESGTNQPLQGATVQVKGSSATTQTGPDGSYRIQVSKNAKALIFSFVGHQLLELSINSSGVLNAGLSTSTQSLED